MADSDNSGQYGNRPDTEENAHEGGKKSTGKFGSGQGADPSKAGKMGAKAQPHEAKMRGGKNSHRSSSNS